MNESDDFQWRMDVVEKLTLLTSKIDAMHGRLDEVVGRQKDLETRVGGIERARLYSRGWMAGALAVAGVIGGLVVEGLKKFMGW